MLKKIEKSESQNVTAGRKKMLFTWVGHILIDFSIPITENAVRYKDFSLASLGNVP